MDALLNAAHLRVPLPSPPHPNACRDVRQALNRSRDRSCAEPREEGMLWDATIRTSFSGCG